MGGEVGDESEDVFCLDSATLVMRDGEEPARHCRAENDSHDRRSFVAVGGSISDRLLGKEIGRVGPGYFVQVKRIAALLFRSIHGHVGMLE